MKFKGIIAAVAVLAMSFAVSAQDITLPEAVKTGGKTMGETFASRKSERAFNPQKEVSLQTLSNLLWSATGINRQDGKRTNPTAMNRQEVDLYVFNRDGVYRYDYAGNSLKKVASGDHRELVAGAQKFVLDAPVSIVLVADVAKLGNDERSRLMAACDAGIACQNINLFCAANGLATVPRASMDAAGIVKLLNLGKDQMPLLNNPVGYSK